MLKNTASTVDSTGDTLHRRQLLNTAAWAVPVLAAAAAVPLAAASGTPDIEVGAFRVQGSCGILGVLGPGFTITASATEPLPVGTTMLIIGSGVANIGFFTPSGAVATVNVLSGTARLVTLTAGLPAGATLTVRTTLSISVAFTLNGTVTLPNGYVATGAKPSGTVSSTLILCSGS